MLYIYHHLNHQKEHPAEPISPKQATMLLDKCVTVKSILEAWEDDHELSFVVACQTNDDLWLNIAMNYCVHETEWTDLLCWSLTNQNQRVLNFVNARLHDELIQHKEMDMRDI